MKIVLINPYCLDPRLQDYDIRVVPIGLYYIGACLKAAGHSCEILNFFDMQGKQGQIREILGSVSPDLVGVSILHANRWGGIDIARISKSLFPEIPVVFGGPGAVFLWQHLLNHFREIDFIVMGEGEQAMTTMADLLAQGKHGKIPSLPGIASRHGKTLMANDPPAFIEDLDTLPDPSEHFTFQHVVSSRGCPWNCAFCGSPRIWNRKVRFHSPDYFVNQIANLAGKGEKFFYVSDDTFTLKQTAHI